MRAMVGVGRVKRRRFGVVIAAGLLAGCAGSPRRPATIMVPHDVFAAETPPTATLSRIRPSDRLSVRVLFEPDLSSPEARVDASGMISLPIVGDVRAAGLTTAELTALITRRMQQYVQKPQVTVALLSTAGDHVVVDGNVVEPGVYDIAGNAGLLEVLARAKGPNRTAALGNVIVFRQIDGRRAGAVFDVGRIRRGADAEPLLYPGDTVVVGSSFLKGAYRDFLSVAPAAIAVFRFY